jgi:hypothetical protein
MLRLQAVRPLELAEPLIQAVVAVAAEIIQLLAPATAAQAAPAS